MFLNILILTGGQSTEREVAIRSGKAVASAFIDLGHSVALVDILRVPDASDFCFTNDQDRATALFLSWQKRKPTYPLDPNIIKISGLADKIFPALHGGIGEDGRLAAFFECFNQKCSGSSPCALANTMDKIKSKIFYENAGILTPAYTVYNARSKRKPIPPRYPCVIKPSDGGSSIGVEFASNASELDNAIQKATAVCDEVILEEKIIGREFSVSVLNDEPLAITEIIPKNSYYDYESKYIHGGAREITPAPLPSELTMRALSVAKRAHQALGLKNFSRTDLILKKGTSLFYALETNAQPGLTKTSILPSCAQVCQISFPRLCQRML